MCLFKTSCPTHAHQNAYPHPPLHQIIINALYTKQKTPSPADIYVILKVNRVGLVPDK